MLRRTAAASVAALSIAATLGATAPAQAATTSPAKADPAVTARLVAQLRAEAARRVLHLAADVRAGKVAAAPVAPFALSIVLPPQAVEGTPLVVAIAVADPDLVDAETAPAPGSLTTPTGEVTFYDAVRPYQKPFVLTPQALGTEKLEATEGAEGVATAALQVTGLAELHDIAMTYGGDTAFSPIPAEKPVFADAEVVFGGAQGLPRQLTQRLYYDLLSRRPDAGGYEYWLPVTQAGHYGDVAYSFSLSSERLGTEIDAAYRAFLGRAADPGGQAFYLDLFRKGLTVQGLQIRLAQSREFSDLVGTDGGDIADGLYRAILGRPADPGGRAYYAGLLDTDAVSVGAVAFELAYSDESLLSVLGELYFEVLSRPIDPEGQAYWPNAIRAGYRQELVAFSMTQNDEYRNLLVP